MVYENVVKLCGERGISVSRLEKECELGNATIRCWETSSPSVANVQKVAKYFNIPIADLLNPPPNESA